MTGISWGGFNSLQVAARRPPALKAIITLMSTDDRYADDVHYKGGCVRGPTCSIGAPACCTARPAAESRQRPGAGWREQWLSASSANATGADTWLAHQRRDAYWKHGSVCEDYAAIQSPVYAIGGWVDGYTNAVLRLLQGLPGPRKGSSARGRHAYPAAGRPGPAIGYLQEALRWWDHWLKGADTGIMDEPMLRVWMQELDPRPANSRQTRALGGGRPVARSAVHRAALASWRRWDAAAQGRRRSQARSGGIGVVGGETGGTDAPGAALTIRGSQFCGADAGAWCAEGQPSDRAPDQRAAEGQSLCFTSAPLAGAVEILGRPLATLRLAADRPLALVAVRLDDVAPNGVSLLVTQQVLNLTHRESHEHPSRSSLAASTP